MGLFREIRTLTEYIVNILWLVGGIIILELFYVLLEL